MPAHLTRRDFLLRTATAGAGLAAAGLGMAPSVFVHPAPAVRANLRLGLVTYLWGQDWDVPTLIRNCEATGLEGVELRTEHAHGVETDLSDQERNDVKARFQDSNVTLVGLGTNFEFHSPDPDELRQNIEGAKAYLQLSHDVGGSGVKVKPNAIPEEVPIEQTIQQIGTSLNELGRFAADLGQEVRVEVHGRRTQQLPVLKQIMNVARHPRVVVCWNSNPQDLEGEGLAYNFNLVKDRFGQTVHVRELDDPDYPYQHLMDLFVAMGYEGWILLEARGEPEDRIQALKNQAALFEEMVANAEAKLHAEG